MLNESNIPLEEDGIEEEILVDEEVAITKAMWGDIGGNIENQTDLQNALDAKQDSLTEAQLNAVNSGITAEKVTTYDGYADQIASKADQSALNAEATTREQADTALGRRIDDEATARQNADNGLQSQIDAITSKSDVVDVVANYAALQAYDTSSLSDNDVIKVLDDETHEDALTYYRWSTTTQTWSYIGQEAPYYSKGQMDVMLQGKQDKLTAGANIQIQNGTISATDTTYTAGNGLNLNGTEFSTDTDVLATKEDLEDYYTKSETDTFLAPKLEAEVVAELPTTGEEGKLYLTPKAHTTQTATGNPITATVSEEAGALESFQLDGDTFQQTYAGKNLFDKDNYSEIQAFIDQNGVLVSNANNIAVYIPCEANTTYTISRKVPTSGNTKFGVGYTTTTPAGGVQLYDWTREYFAQNLTVTTGAGAAYLVVWVYVTDYVETKAQTMESIQIEVGSTATAYEPYVGGQPSPSPEYPQPIQTVTGEQTVEIMGKNLFDGVTTNQVILSDGTIVDNNIWNLGEFIKVEPNTAYTVSFKLGSGGSHSVLVAEFDSNKSFINRSGSQNTAPYTFTTGSTTEYIRLNYNNTNNDTDFQIELGSTATDYAPYSKQTLPLDLGGIELCELGDYQDYIWKYGDDWKIRKNTNRFTFETRQLAGLSKQPLGFIYNFENNPLVGKHVPLVGECSHFDVEPTTTTWTALNKTGMNSLGALWFRTTDTNQGDTRTIDEFGQWLVDAGVSFVYAIATPTDTVITDTTLIAQLEAIRTASLQNGANTITNTATGSNLAGDMEIGYYGYNPRNRYDKWLWLDLNNNYEQIGS